MSRCRRESGLDRGSKSGNGLANLMQRMQGRSLAERKTEILLNQTVLLTSGGKKCACYTRAWPRVFRRQYTSLSSPCGSWGQVHPNPKARGVQEQKPKAHYVFKHAVQVVYVLLEM